MAIIHITVDDVLAQQFKENCSKKGISAQDAILNFIKKSSRGLRLSFRRKNALEKGRNAFHALREKARQSGKTFSADDIEGIIAETRLEG